MEPDKKADSAVIDIGSNDDGENVNWDYSTSPLHLSDVEDTPGSMDDVHYRQKSSQLPVPQGATESTQANVHAQIGQNVSMLMWETSKQQAQRAFSVFGNVDYLRPYFDVEPMEVRSRLLHSLIPMKPANVPEAYGIAVLKRLPHELYGPLMLVFTLIALLLYHMKMSNHVVADGTLMGAALGICFGYWFGVSSLVWSVAYICSCRISLTQTLSLMGYALVSNCIVLLAGTLLHTSHDHLLFYLLWALFGGLSALRMGAIFISRTPDPSHRTAVCCVAVGLHLLFLLYLHFGYHQSVEEFATVMNDGVPQIHAAKGTSLVRSAFSAKLL